MAVCARSAAGRRVHRHADVHATGSGLVDDVVDSEIEALQLARQTILDWHLAPRPPAPGASEAPRFSPEELYGIIPANPRKRLQMPLKTYRMNFRK